MHLKFYRTERKYDKGMYESHIIGSQEDLIDTAETTMSEDDWYTAVIYHDDEETVFARFTKTGGKYFYLPNEMVESLNMIISGALESGGVKASRTLHIEDGKEDYQISHSTGKEEARVSYKVDFAEEALDKLSKLEEYVRSLGFDGMECIMFSPRRAGRYKSACVSPSKLEVGKARVTLDMH